MIVALTGGRARACPPETQQLTEQILCFETHVNNKQTQTNEKKKNKKKKNKKTKRNTRDSFTVHFALTLVLRLVTTVIFYIYY